jgi:hypothetical protein
VPTTTDDIEALERALDADPADWDARMVAADAYEEAGDADMAFAMRWMAKNERHPVTRIGFGWYGWTSPAFKDCSELPKELLMALIAGVDDSNWRHKSRCYGSRRDAERALADALARCRAEEVGV